MEIERNELSRNARGGTELMQEALVRHLDPELLSKFQIIPSRVRELDPNKKKILWLHDLPNDPESQHLRDPESRERFDGFVCVSDWQMQAYNSFVGLPYSKSIVLANAIEPLDGPRLSSADNKVRLVYHTTPHRGLELLIPVFIQLTQDFPNVHLDVFSSFNVYGWGERDKPYECLFDICRDHPQITYHGAQDNETVRSHLLCSDIFAYPCIWPETSCIAAIEALSAGNIVVCPNFAALPETTAKWGFTYQFTEDMQEHANRFYVKLHGAVTHMTERRDMFRAHIEMQRAYYRNFYTWERRKLEWEAFLKGLLIHD